MAGSETQTVDPAPSQTLVWLVFLGAIVSAVVGGFIFLSSDPNLHLDPEGIAIFAPIYVAAAAIERILEPIASRYNTTEKQKEDVKAAREKKLGTEQRAKTLQASGQSIPQGDLDEATGEESKANARLEKKRTERKLIFFLIASVASCLLAGFLGLGLLEAMSTQQLKGYLGAIDVAITGLVIGAGTKPLHDLIARLEKSKENADPADKPTTQVAATSPVVPPPTPQ